MKKSELRQMIKEELLREVNEPDQYDPKYLGVADVRKNLTKTIKWLSQWNTFYAKNKKDYDQRTIDETEDILEDMLQISKLYKKFENFFD